MSAAEGANGAFVLCKLRHNVSLSPCHIGEPRVGIEQEMTALLMQYSEPVKGVILAFNKVELEKPKGFIINEMPYIHCKVRADALVFRPTPGMRLEGTVNKIGSNHVGMLFAGVFNGSVAAAELPKGYVHNYHEDCWLAADGSSIAVNDVVDVKVLKVHMAGGMIAIEGTMRFKGAKVVVHKAPKITLDLSSSRTSAQTPGKKTVFGDDDEEKEEEVEEPAVAVEKKKKSKKSKKTEAEVEEPSTEAAEPKKSKKSKKVEVEEPSVEIAEPKKSKKSKKIKEEPVVEEAETKKSKKKRKHAEEEVAVKEEAPVVTKEKKHKKKKSKAE